MTKFVDIKPSSTTISDFYDNDNAHKYNYNPGCQRESGVWDADTKSFLIDSILKNYPLPPIFLRPKVNTDNGKTTYDVIDGKQRLETIIDFINDKVKIPEDFGDDEFFDDNKKASNKIAGLTFSEIIKNKVEFKDYIQQFWSYTLNLSIVQTDDDDLVDSLFDRLNRNGEPLNSQELRKSKYNKTVLLKTITEIAENEFWKEKLRKKKRMQDKEFISILVFTIAKNKIIETNRNILNDLYNEYSLLSDFSDITRKMKNIEKNIIDFELDFNNKRKLLSPTHLYTIFSLAHYEVINNKKLDSKKVRDFFDTYFNKYDDGNPLLFSYKKASSNRTHSEESRKIRLESILKFIGE